MKIKVEIDDQEFKSMLKERLYAKVSDITIADEDIHIEVMSKQNYKQKEWEKGSVRCWVEVNTMPRSLL